MIQNSKKYHKKKLKISGIETTSDRLTGLVYFVTL
jgi:hypothetical protein